MAMEWYYADGGLKVGPVSEEELSSRLARGILNPGTLVWCQGMPEWKPLREVAPGVTRDTARDTTWEKVADQRSCSLCSGSFPADEVLRFGDHWICAACKPAYLQRLRQGVDQPGTFRYGGFWLRGLAQFVDGLILGVPGIVLFFVVFPPFFAGLEQGEEAAAMFSVYANLMQLAAMALGLVYTVFFWGRYGATPGKMVCGLKVVRPDGSHITYLRALGRYLANFLSMIFLYIGYLMAAFDRQKRSLHDRICDTRVIRTR
ncbi:MAG: RDD family protein [Thermodesulfobacteriota bacterium]|jgi:uncharacterized RDD family membrane protein YckC